MAGTLPKRIGGAGRQAPDLGHGADGADLGLDRHQRRIQSSANGRVAHRQNVIGRCDAQIFTIVADQQRDVFKMAVGVADQLAEGSHHGHTLGVLCAEVVRVHAACSELRPRIARTKELVIHGACREHAQASLLAHAVKALHFQKDIFVCHENLGLGGGHPDIGQCRQCQMLQRQQLGHAAAELCEFDDDRARILGYPEELGLLAAGARPIGFMLELLCEPHIDAELVLRLLAWLAQQIQLALQRLVAKDQVARQVQPLGKQKGDAVVVAPVVEAGRKRLVARSGLGQLAAQKT